MSKQYDNLMQSMREYKGPQLICTAKPDRPTNPVFQKIASITIPGKDMSIEYNPKPGFPGKDFIAVYSTETDAPTRLSLEEAIPQDFKSMTQDQLDARRDEFRDLNLMAWAVQQALPDMTEKERINACSAVVDMWQASTIRDYNKNDTCERPFETASANISGLQGGLLNYIQAGCDAYAAGFADESPIKIRELANRFQDMARTQVQDAMALYDAEPGCLNFHEKRCLKAFHEDLKEKCVDRYLTTPGDTDWSTGIQFVDFEIPTPRCADLKFNAESLPIEWPGVQRFEQENLSGTCARNFPEEYRNPEPPKAPEKASASARDMRDLETACQDIEEQSNQNGVSADFDI